METELSVSVAPLQTLIATLKAIFKRTNWTPEEIRLTIAHYIANHSDWKRYVFFSPHKYARNLVEINEDFELIVICWLPGHESPIHNHSSQNCWMSVVEGDIEEIYFSVDKATGKLTQGPTNLYKQGMVGYLYDDLALHKVRPVNGIRGVTIHLYNKPIPLCSLYCPLTGKVTRVKSAFFSQYGKKVSCESQCYKDLYTKLKDKQDICPKYKNLLRNATQEELVDTVKLL